MRKITRPGQAALAASKKDDDVIDVDSGDTSAFPRAAGGLRKLFQIPAAANGDEPAAESGNGAKNGSSKPSGGTAGASKGASTKGSPTKGAQTKGTQARSGQASSSSGSGANSGARRRNNKKRKRR